MFCSKMLCGIYSFTTPRQLYSQCNVFVKKYIVKQPRISSYDLFQIPNMIFFLQFLEKYALCFFYKSEGAGEGVGEGRREDQWEAWNWSWDLRANERPKLHLMAQTDRHPDILTHRHYASMTESAQWRPIQWLSNSFHPSIVTKYLCLVLCPCSWVMI